MMRLRGGVIVIVLVSVAMRVVMLVAVKRERALRSGSEQRTVRIRHHP